MCDGEGGEKTKKCTQKYPISLLQMASMAGDECHNSLKVLSGSGIHRLLNRVRVIVFSIISTHVTFAFGNERRRLRWTRLNLGESLGKRTRTRSLCDACACVQKMCCQPCISSISVSLRIRQQYGLAGLVIQNHSWPYLTVVEINVPRRGSGRSLHFLLVFLLVFLYKSCLCGF